MFNRLKAQWGQLRRSKPGHRFQDRYQHHRHDRNATTLPGRILRYALAAVLIALGVIFMFIPGPAILFYALAGALLSAEARWVARTLDWLELRGRQLVRWAKKHWRRLPTAGKAVVTTLAVCGSAAGTLLFYRFVAN